MKKKTSTPQELVETLLISALVRRIPTGRFKENIPRIEAAVRKFMRDNADEISLLVQTPDSDPNPTEILLPRLIELTRVNEYPVPTYPSKSWNS